MKVYVVMWRYSYDDYGIDTIWVTEEAARKYLEEYTLAPEEEYCGEFWLDELDNEYYIEEHELKEN